MRRRSVVIAGAILIILVAAGAVRAIALRPADYPQPARSGVSGRVWREVAHVQPVQIPGSGHPLLNPLQVQEGPGGTLYVLDYGDLTIKAFGSDGRHLRTYGRGQGRGPGEAVNPTDFHVTASGEVWMLDPAQSRIQVFDPDARPVRTIPITVPALRIAVHGDAFTTFAPAGVLFHRFNHDGRPRSSFGRLVPDQLEQAIALQGEAKPTHDGGMLYMPLRGGYIARFTSDGELAYYRETVSPKPFPEIGIRADGARIIPQQSTQELSTVSASVHGDTAFLLTPAVVDGKTRAVIDVYDVPTGRYQYTFRTPQPRTRSIHVTSEYLYTTADTVVTRWNRHELLQR
jgi:hypothetical protein